MHLSTITAILAFTAGINAIPLRIEDGTPVVTDGSELLPFIAKPQRREAQQGRQFLKGVGEGIETSGNLLNTKNSINGQQKRKAQRGRGRVVGNIAEGIGGAIGGAADLLQIGGAVQGQQKREAQRNGNSMPKVPSFIGCMAIGCGPNEGGLLIHAEKREALNDVVDTVGCLANKDCDLDVTIPVPAGIPIPANGFPIPGGFKREVKREA